MKKWVYILSCNHLCRAERCDFDSQAYYKCTLVSLPSYLLTAEWRGHVLDFMNTKRVEENNQSLMSAEFIQRLNCKHIHTSPPGACWLDKVCDPMVKHFQTKLLNRHYDNWNFIIQGGIGLLQEFEYQCFGLVMHGIR